MADENLHGLPISSLPKADELNQTDQLIAYREDDGKAYRSNVGALAEASTANIGDAFATTVQYNAGDYCIYNDTLYKFTDFKDIGSWDDSVVEKVTVADEVKSNTEKIQENTDLIDKRPVIQSGMYTITSTGSNTNTSAQITFDEPFSSTPVVMATPQSSDPLTFCPPSVMNPSATGFTLWCARTNSANMAIYWVAIGY